MNRPSLSAEQLAVVQSKAGRLVVRASAGSGKTRTLVERYVNLVIEGGFSPDNIVAITFTNKASAELRERIVHELRAQNRYRDAQLAESGPIGTTHSFFERCLRENSIEAGIDPAFEIFDGSEDRQMLLDIIRNVIVTADLTDENISLLIQTLLGKPSWRGGGQPTFVLEQPMEKIIGSFRGTGWSPGELEERYGTVESTLRTWQKIYCSTHGLDEGFLSDPESFVRRLNAEPGLLKSKIHLQKKDTDVDSIRAAQFTVGLIKLSLQAWTTFESAIRRRGGLDFNAIELEMRRMLRTQPRVAKRLQAKYKVLMMDECQDVSPLQRETLALIGFEQEVFVGDVKQSIYSFRLADPEGFERLANESETLELSRNYRSSDAILRLVDTVFEEAMKSYSPMLPKAEFDLDAEPEAVSPEGVERWNLEASNPLAIADAIIKYLNDAEVWGEDTPQVTVLVEKSVVGQMLMSALRQRGIEAEYRGDSARFYTKLEVRDVANALRAVANPTNDYALLALLRSCFVGVSLDTLFDLGRLGYIWDHLADYSPAVEGDRAILDQFLVWFKPLTAQADRLNAWEIISKLYATSPFLPELAQRRRGVQMLANARKLLTLAIEFADEGPGEFADRIEKIRELQHKEGEAAIGDGHLATVEIMTAHSSKGLEFDNVIVATLGRVPRRKENLETSLGEGLISFDYAPDGENLFHRMTLNKRKEKDAEENLRLAYVAMTRAKKRLILLCSPKMRAPTAGSVVMSVLRERTDLIREREFTPGLTADQDR
jgi:ATP-dependent exoDNAse (exonuclease V) beta subunit